VISATAAFCSFPFQERAARAVVFGLCEAREQRSELEESVECHSRGEIKQRSRRDNGSSEQGHTHEQGIKIKGLVADKMEIDDAGVASQS
jgi:hypothetical protein